MAKKIKLSSAEKKPLKPKKSFKFRFYPSIEEQSLLAQWFGSQRFVYNHVLDYSIKHYSNRQHKTIDDFGNEIIIPHADYKPLSSTDRINILTELKKEFPWLEIPSSIILQQSIRHLNDAYSRFFNGKGKLGFPQFKKKSNRNSFTITGQNSLHFDSNGHYTLPKFDTPLKIKFSRDFPRDKVSSITVSKEPSGHYYISFLVNYEHQKLIPNNKKIAFDSGIKTTATVFNLEQTLAVKLPDLNALLDKINKAQKELSRKQKGSHNRNKARVKLARLHAKKTRIVEDFHHKLSYNIIKENQFIVAEDLDIMQMKTTQFLLNQGQDEVNRKQIRRHLQHIALGKLYNFIEYKSEWYGRTFIQADRYYPSSKLCSSPGCGYINHELKLSQRTWKCPKCKVVHDRDENAAKNLYYYEEHNAQQIIKEVLAYHQAKKQADKNSKQSSTMNTKTLNFSKKEANIVLNTVGRTGIQACGDGLSP